MKSSVHSQTRSTFGGRVYTMSLVDAVMLHKWACRSSGYHSDGDMEESRRVADYFLVVGLPSDPAGQKILDETSLEVTLHSF